MSGNSRSSEVSSTELLTGQELVLVDMAKLNLYVSVSVTRRAVRDRIKNLTPKRMLQHCNAEAQWRKRTTFHYKVYGHGLIDGNFIKIYADQWDWVISWQARIFKNSTTLIQWRGKVKKIWQSSFQTVWSVSLHELPLSVFMDINSGHNWRLWQSTSSWCFNKHHDVCTVAPSTKRVCAIPRALGQVACG